MAGSQGLEGMIVDSHCVVHVFSKEFDEKRASLCTQTLSLLTKQMLHPR